MNDYVQKMVDDAIRHIDSLSIIELEREFRSFGLEAIRKKNVPYFTNHFSSPSTSSFELDVLKSKKNAWKRSTNTEFSSLEFISFDEHARNDEFYYLRDYDYKIAA